MGLPICYPIHFSYFFFTALLLQNPFHHFLMLLENGINKFGMMPLPFSRILFYELRPSLNLLVMTLSHRKSPIIFLHMDILISSGS